MNVSGFSAPIGERYFEDYVEGAVLECGPISIEEAEIIAFAKRYDPQSIHTDPQAAARGPFHGLIASGWHTVGLMTRLFMTHFLSSVASLGSPGIDEVRWFKAVRPGDQLRLRVSVVETKPSRSKLDRGMVRSLLECFNQNGELVASFKAMNLLSLRTQRGNSKE